MPLKATAALSVAACVAVCWARESSGAVGFCPPGSPVSPPRPLLGFLPSPRGLVSVPVRPELHARRLFKVTDCFVPKSPLEHAAAAPPLVKKSDMFYTDQTPSHPHKAYHRRTREIIEAATG